MEKAAPKQSEDFRYIVRVSNTDIDGNRKIVDSLRKIKGISFSFANAICLSSGIDRSSKTGELKDAQVKKLEETITNAASIFPEWMLNRRKDFEETAVRHLVTTDLTFAQENDIRFMKRIKSYRGIRHMHGAPVRGQRTRSNFRRNKGKVMGVGKSKQTGTSGK